jgi:hypothetical protein
MTAHLSQPVERHPYDTHGHEDHHDHHHIHHHDHQHSQPEQSISQGWKWMTVLGNAAIGTAELVTGNLSTMSVASDGLHNVGDSVTYYMQAENILNPNISEERRTRMRKVGHWIIAATSLGVSIKAGTDLALGHEGTPDPMTLYAASASLALNGFMLARLRSGIRRRKHAHNSVHENDLTKHFLAVDMPSAGLAVAGAILQKYSVNIEQVAAIASGLVGAYAFRPTDANLSHNCLDHDHALGGHAHDEHHHHGHQPPGATRNQWRARMAYKPRHGLARQERLSRLFQAARMRVTKLAIAGMLADGTQPATEREQLYVHGRAA